jgi:trans-2,3-dihydro-3-hydroxyanthranilate isomerase
MGDGEHSVSLYQGVEMGRPSHIRLRLRIEASRLTELMIGGDAVKVAEGTLLLDQ